jgi:hypothetical protein|tara:strand:- start:862 stop:1122 length:261 start_codon:yes stop_codon:yes gene_type:complete
MYEVMNGITVKDKYFAEGEFIDGKGIPQKSIKWLIEQGTLVKITKAEKEKKLQESTKVRARNDKGHFIADDPNTEENEAWVEKEEE